MNSYHILGQHAHWNVNKKLARLVGLEAALLISDLISKREYFIQNKDITLEDWFFNTQENIEVDTGLTPHQQRKAFEILKSHGFIETQRKGIPAKQHFKIFDVQLLKILITGSENFEYLYNKNKDNKNKEEKQKVFVVEKQREFEVLETFKEPYNTWMSYKAERGESYKSEKSKEQFYKLLLKLSNNNPLTAMQIVNQSMANNWAGIFPLKAQIGQKEPEPVKGITLGMK